MRCLPSILKLVAGPDCTGTRAGKSMMLEFLEMPAAMQDVERIAEK